MARLALVLDDPEMAIWARGRGGVADLSGLIHHHHADSDTSIVFTGRLAAAGLDASVGSVADADDDALAEIDRGGAEELFPGLFTWSRQSADTHGTSVGAV